MKKTGRMARLRITRDITWHKFNENAVKYEQQRLFTVLDSLPAYISLIAPDYSIRFANRFFRERFGQPEGKTCYEMYHHANAPCEACQSFNIFTANTPQSCEWTSPAGDYYQAYVYPFTYLDGSPLLLELGIDITEHKKALENLRLSEERFSKAFYGSPSSMAIIATKDSCFTNVNDVLLNISGYSRDEMIGRTVKELNIFADPEDQAKVRQLTREQGFIRNLEISFRMKSGEVRAGLLSTEIFELCGEQCILVSINDIHERKQAEELFRTLTHNSPVGIYIVQNGKFQFVNPQFRKYTDYHEAELIGMDAAALIMPEDRTMVRENAIKMLQGKRVAPYEYRLTRRGGQTRWMMETVAPIQYRKNPAILGNCIDITWHKRTKKALRLSEERFSKAFHTSPNPMFIATLSDGRYIEANQSFYRTFGYSRQEVIGHKMGSLDIFVHPNDYHYIIQMPMEQGMVHNLETSLRTKTGEVRVVLLSADSIEIHGRKCLLGIINDITEMKQMRKEMARLERLNLVGEMAAGIGHEIRNPMTTVRGFLQMLQNKKEYAKDKKYFHLMLEELDRANSIITEFLSMAKNRPVDLKLLNLNHVVQTLFPLIQADSMNADQYIETELTEIPDLLLDEKEIRQLILNLVRNGIETMSPGGKLIIRTSIIGADIVLSVQDQGPGIAPEAMEKIGTPFFTTKDTGTGLGLAVCYSIAARHNAVIDIETGPGGTTFYIRFKKAGHC